MALELPAASSRSPARDVRLSIINSESTTMAFFYSDTKAPGRSEINVWKMNGTNGYLRHYDNYLFLHFVSQNPAASEQERRQARHELTICEKKLDFWKRHPSYDHDEALRRVVELKRNWQVEAA